jgi:hypothetical protein
VNIDDTQVDIHLRWASYKAKFEKFYASNKLEESTFSAFSANDQIIHQHNVQGLSWQLGHNNFSDMTWNQFKASHLGFVDTLARPKKYEVYNQSKVLADSLDWVDKGAVTPVKNL